MKLHKMLKHEAESVRNNKDIFNRNCKDLLISARFDDNHIHHILPEQNITDMIVEDLLSYASEKVVKYDYDEPDKETREKNTKSNIPDEIIFRNRQALGDIFTMTCAIRDFKKAFPQVRVGVQSTAMHIWDNNPYIDHSFRTSVKDKVLNIGPGFLTNKSNLWNTHMANAFRLDIENKLNLRIPQGEIRPDIWLSQEEYDRDPLIDGAYWVFIYGGEPGWPVKQYHRWQEVINLLKDDIKIVQLGVSNHPYPILDGVVNYVGKTQDRNTGIRDLFNIFLHAQGSLGLVSMHMHLAAAFGNPCVVLAGAREPAWFTQYYGHQYIQTNGTMHCAEQKACWKCKLEGCVNLVDSDKIQKGHNTNKVPKCVDIIEPEEIAEAVRKYYKGGRLEYGKKIPNKFFKNITKEKKVFTVPKPDKVDDDLLKKFGFKWGGGSITDRDWMFLKDIIKQYNVTTVLEFGAGLSSLLFGTAVDKVITFETQQGWIDKMNKNAGDNNFFIPWDGKNLDLKPEDFKVIRFDLAFVDGPAGGANREFSTKYASQLSDLVVVHDAGRQHERMWQEKYLSKDYTLVAKGGHRCHFWAKKEICQLQEKKEEAERVKIVENDDRPSFRMITTCRGFGGSERSSLFIMKDFLKRGYRVELIPTGNVSGEYQKNIPMEVMVRPWREMKQPVDIITFYTSDCVYNFKSPQYMSVMDQLNCKRKVMILNYQLGGAGQLDWTKNWDLYMFLNSTKEGELLKRLPNVKTQICPPPTDLSEFFKIQPKFDGTLRLIRHNSQRDAKHPDYTNDLITKVLDIDEGIQFFYMPPYSKTFEHPNVHKFKVNQIPVPQFLSYGNCFWYHLGPDYQDQGPRVALEAAACGLPLIGDNRYGMKDRVTPEIGWLCDDVTDYLEVIQEIIDNPDILKIKGDAAKKYARENFIPERWADHIIGNE